MSNGVIEATLGTHGVVLSAGAYVDAQIPSDALIYRWTAVADVSGSIQVDVRVCHEDQFDGGVTHPVSGDSITGGNPIAIASSTKGQDVALSGWSKTVVAGDIMRFVVTSVTTIEQVTISVEFIR